MDQRETSKQPAVRFPSISQAEAMGTTPAAIYAKWNRKRANRVMREFRKVPREQHAQHVCLMATQVTPEFIETNCLSGMDNQPQAFWMKHRALAKKLVAIDAQYGGSGFAVTWEYRRCKVCRRLLLGPQATEYRERERWPKRTWHYPQGPCCEPDCKPKEKPCSGLTSN